MKITDVMTAPVFTVSPETSLKEAATILVEQRITALPVVDSEGRVIGVVSESEILFEDQPPPQEKGLFARFFTHGDPALRRKLEAATVGDAMTAPAITIAPDASVSRAAAKMLDAGVRRLPVVDGSGRLVGIVTRADLMRALVRPDDAIEKEIRDVITMFSIPPKDVAVSVEQGDVRVTGTVETRTVAEAIPALVERVPGVADVVTELEWRLDPDLPHDRDVLGPPQATEEGTP